MTESADSRVLFSDALIEAWRNRLRAVIGFYEGFRGRTPSFFTKAYAAFFVLNIACYWLAITTAFPERVFGADWLRYALIQVPVGILGATFDIFSLVVTVYIIRRAIAARSKLVYVAHIGVDLVIAVMATAWVLIVFSVSTWLVDTLAPSLPQSPTQSISAAKVDAPTPASQPQTQDRASVSVPKTSPAPPALSAGDILTRRSGDYRRRFVDAVTDPFAPENLKNIYFGVVMGASAMMPSLVHLYAGFISLVALLLLLPARETD